MKRIWSYYEWANSNHMEFNENKFERMTHGNKGITSLRTYKTKYGKEIKPNKTIKDLGVLTSGNVWFSEHNDDLKFSSKIKPCLLLKALKAREAEQMMKIWNDLDYSLLI